VAILEGAVVFIDDQYDEENTHANDFYNELKNAGRPIAAYDKLPDAVHMDHWDGLALAIVDWNLRAKEDRVPGATTLDTGDRRRMAAFLVALLGRYFCPVFIISTDSYEQIADALKAADGFPADAIGSRIRILQKEDVADAFIANLEQEVRSNPVLSILRTWEQQYQTAKNRMFIELGGISTDWPSHIVKGAKDDNVDPGYEILETLNANVRHRMDPVSFDLEVIDIANLSGDGEASRRVRFGRSILQASSLHPTEVMPGDFFSSWRKSDPANTIWLNLTPACYTVRGRRKPGDPDVRLHLIRGVPETVPSDAKRFAQWERERQRASRSELVHVLHGGMAYKFDFSTLQTFSWTTVSKHRLGRVLPPFITQVQQRHAAFLTSEGLPRVLPEMYQVALEPVEGT
jgi:hypothetical protein